MIRRLVLAAAFVLAASPVLADQTADIFGGFQAKSTDPIQVDAAALETSEEGTQRISVFSGGVTVKRGNTTLKAGTIKLYSGLQGEAASSFSRIEAGGGIKVTSKDQVVTGDTAVVDMATNTITVDGNVVLSQGPNVISGAKLVVNLSTGRARVDQAPGKQIRGVFSPASN
jgi:lipopolysaccharide export system protein LptA